MKVLKNMGITIALALSAAVFSGCDTPLYITGGITYSNPAWAPPYHPGARYYYMPDIETYYDMADHQYIYLQNGQWMYSQVLPSVYAQYDLYSGFVITLNIGVYQPWMHHQYYVSHYPRYYYQNIYQADYRNMRGYNENDRKPFYWLQGDQDRMRDLRNNPPPAPRPEVKLPPHNTNYYGRPVGDPVKVKPQMKKKVERKVRN